MITKKQAKRMLAGVMTAALMVTGLNVSKLTVKAAQGDQTLIEGAPQILMYEVPTDRNKGLYVEGKNIYTPMNTTFTLNANKDVTWSFTTDAEAEAQINADPNLVGIRINADTGVVHIPYNTVQQNVTVTATANDNTKTSFFIYVSDKMATADSVQFDWKTAASFADKDVISYNETTDVLTVKGKASNVRVPYNISPSYIDNKHIKISVANNENITFEHTTSALDTRADSTVYNYDNRIRLAGDPDGFVRLDTIFNETAENPEGHFLEVNQEEAKATVKVLADKNGKYTAEREVFKPLVENEAVHIKVYNNKTSNILDTEVDSANVKNTQTILLNANNEFSLLTILADNISWFKDKQIIDYNNTLNTISYFYYINEVSGRKEAREIADGATIGNLPTAAEETGNAITVDNNYDTIANNDPFYRKLELSRDGQVITVKTPLAVPTVTVDAEKDVRNVYLVASVQPRDSNGQDIGERVEVTYLLDLELNKEDISSVSLDIDSLRAQGFAKTEIQDVGSGNEAEVVCLAAYLEDDTANHDIVLNLNNLVEFDKQYLNLLARYYDVKWEIREAEKAADLERQTWNDFNGNMTIGNELKYCQVRITIGATALGQKYGLGANTLTKEYYFEVIPNIDFITWENELTLSGNLVTTETEVIHAMKNQTLTPDCNITSFYQTYKYNRGGQAGYESDYRTVATPYIKRGLVKFHSTNPDVATVDANGTISAKKSGVTYVMAYSEPSIYAEADPILMRELGFDMSKYVCSGASTINGSGAIAYNPAQYIKVVVGEESLALANISLNAENAQRDNPSQITIKNLEDGSRSLQVAGRAKFTLGITTEPKDTVDPEVVWSTSNSDVLDIDETTGEITTKIAGTATVTAALKSNPAIKDTFLIAVSAVPITRIDTIVEDVPEDGAILSGTSTNNNGTASVGITFKLKINATPTTATQDQEIIWESSDAAKATVAQNGMVTTHSAGEVKITATLKTDPTVKQTFNLNIDGNRLPNVTSVTPNVAQVNIRVGQTSTIRATVKPSYVTQAVTYESKDPSIATVNANGVITGKKAGKTVIYVTSKANFNKKAEVAVTVSGTSGSGNNQGTTNTVACKAINTNINAATLAIGKTVAIKATKNPANAAGKILYGTTNSKVATVNANGVVTAKKAGSANITVKCGNVTKVVKITVAKNPSLKTKTIKVKKGKKATIKLSNAAKGAKVKYTVKKSDKKKLAVSSKGKISAKKKGKVTVTVKVTQYGKTYTFKCKVTIK